MTFYVEEEIPLFTQAPLLSDTPPVSGQQLSAEKSDRSKTTLPEFSVQALGEQIIAAVMDITGCPHEAQVELLLTDNEGIRAFNNEFRSIDSATDVLSFPGLEFDRPADFGRADRHAFDPESGELMLGDIVISVEAVHAQAAEYGHSLKREFGFLLVHGLLHLCGYDHILPEDAALMEALQEEILGKLAISRA
ncbi:MAG: rRNA maturation RNase YbeY [Lachnospiraceae bacterium]|jgi:probable rRNA maturation factor|nr:rRNA maturation RNase YbeY [Lachnospiraceae bacterium]